MYALNVSGDDVFGEWVDASACVGASASIHSLDFFSVCSNAGCVVVVRPSQSVSVLLAVGVDLKRARNVGTPGVECNHSDAGLFRARFKFSLSLAWRIVHDRSGVVVVDARGYAVRLDHVCKLARARLKLLHAEEALHGHDRGLWRRILWSHPRCPRWLDQWLELVNVKRHEFPIYATQRCEREQSRILESLEKLQAVKVVSEDDVRARRE